METRGQGDKETRGHGNMETRGQGDKETRGHGNMGKDSFTLSPSLLVSPSPCHLVTLSPLPAPIRCRF